MALKREHGCAAGRSAILRRLRAEQPPELTMRLERMPGDPAQVDFGTGPMLLHPEGRQRRTWTSVVTLAHSPQLVR